MAGESGRSREAEALVADFRITAAPTLSKFDRALHQIGLTMADPYCPIVTLDILLGVPTILLIAALARLVIIAGK